MIWLGPGFVDKFGVGKFQSFPKSLVLVMMRCYVSKLSRRFCASGANAKVLAHCVWAIVRHQRRVSHGWQIVVVLDKYPRGCLAPAPHLSVCLKYPL